MTLRKGKISDYISLSHIQTDRFKSGILTLTLTVPAAIEDSAYHLVLPGVLRRGTERYPDMASIHRRLDELYASSVEIRGNRIGKNHSLTVTADLLDEAFVPDDLSIIEGVMEVVAELLLSPLRKDGSFRAEIVKQELQFAKEALEAEINNTRSYAAVRLGELQHRNDPDYPTLARLKEDLGRIDAKNLCEFYERLIVSAPLQVFYVGSLAPEVVSDLLSRYFAKWRVANPKPIIPPVAEAETEFCSLSEKMPVSQGKLTLGFRTGVVAAPENDDCYVATVLNELFGGSPASKLFMNVREKMNLCYYCSSAYNRYTGNLRVSSGIEVSRRAVAEEAILSQLNALKAGEISDAEFHAAKTSLKNAYRQIYDNPLELQGFYGSRELFGLTDDIETAAEKLARVTKEEVVALANRVVFDTVFFVEGTNPTDGGEENDDE